MDKGVWPILLFLLLLVSFAAAILWASDWLKRRCIAKKFPPLSNTTVDFELPCRFEFTSTTEDLLQAYEAERLAVSGLRRAVRWCVVGMGFAWLLGAVVFWSKVSGVQLTIWIFLGVAILWTSVIKPFPKRRQIRITEPSSQDLVLDFTKEGIRFEAQGIGTFDRSWTELDAAIDADEGMLLYFSERIVNWLPRRLFSSDKSKADLYGFLAQRVLENEERQSKENDSESSK